MKIAPDNSEFPYDEYFKRCITRIGNVIRDKNDDYFIIIIGETGTGKSTLALHALDIYMPTESLNINQVALSKEDFVYSINFWSTHAPPKAIVYDEANVSKRASLSKWNKDILDWYFSNRGMNFFHIWCNPSLAMIDKEFVKERLKAIILVRGKELKDKRIYYWFKQEKIVQIFNKYGHLELSLLERIRKKYSTYCGWFKDYNGSLRKPYLEKKENRMIYKTQQLYDKYSDKSFFKPGEVAKQLGVHVDTVSKNNSLLIVDKDYVISAAGIHLYTQEGIDHLRELIKASSSRRGVVS